MRCPFCQQDHDRVLDSRASTDGYSIRRRRECLDCNRRYTTYERLEEIIVKCRDAHPEIPRDAIVGHRDIAPGRKTDPGDSFDWQRIQKTLGLDALPRS